jgi:hypothetical protein
MSRRKTVRIGHVWLVDPEKTHKFSTWVYNWANLFLGRYKYGQNLQFETEEYDNVRFEVFTAATMTNMTMSPVRIKPENDCAV